MEKLLSPLSLSPSRGVTFPNRIVMPPMVIWKADLSGEVTELHREHYRQTAPGCGLAVVEATAVRPEGRLAATQLGLWEDAQQEGLGALAAVIRESGAVAGIQLHHAGSRTTFRRNGGLSPVALSPDAARPELEILTDGQIQEIIESFVTAAGRAVAAGFQLLEIHGAHGYLGAQSLSPHFNRREDRWGGSIERRQTFLVELVRALRRVIPEDTVLSCRLGVADGGPGGLPLDQGIAAARALENAGVDMLHVSHGGTPPEGDSATIDPVLALAKPVKEAVSVPVIGIGSILTAAGAEEALQNGYGDMIAAGRAMLADPFWASKIAGGLDEQIILCRRCQPRCYQFGEPERCPARNVAGLGTPGTPVTSL